MTRVPVTVRRGFVPNGFAAWVPRKRTIVLAPHVSVSEPLLAHELRHVTQAEEAWWPLAYVIQWVANGFSYTSMPYEIEARAAEAQPGYRAWARDLIVAQDLR